jgi:hypothetical protein
LLSSRAFSSEFDTILTTLALASLYVMPEVVDGGSSAVAVAALGLDDERQPTNVFHQTYFMQ